MHTKAVLRGNCNSESLLERHLEVPLFILKEAVVWSSRVRILVVVGCYVGRMLLYAR